MPSPISERNQLVLDSWGMAETIISDRRYRHPHLRRADRRQIALLGMIKAADRYDPARGVPFGALAARMIRWVLTKAVRRADFIRRPNKNVPRLRVCSLDAGLEIDPVDPRPGPEQVLARKDEWDYLTSSREADLTDREREVVELLYGQDRTLSEAARELGVSASRVHAVHRQALERLRRNLGCP